MVTKLKKVSPAAKASSKTAKPAASPKASKTSKASMLSSSVKDSAQQIWQAGLGAFNKAQSEGTKAYEALVKEGMSFQRKTQSAAEVKLSEATQKMTSMASDISNKASGQWDKLESIFEDRVAKALNKLGVPSAKDVEALMARIDALNASVQKLAPAKPTAKTAARARPKVVTKAAPKTAVKSVAKPATKAPVKKPAAKKPAPQAATPLNQVNPV